jgi:hypothetical protein
VGLTPIYQLPYPEITDPADVPTDMRELAERTDGILTGAIGAAARLADVTLAAAAALIDLTAIPQSYAHLLLMLTARTDAATATSGALIRANNDSGASYSAQLLYASGATAGAGEQVAQTSGDLGVAPGGTAYAGLFAGYTVLIPGYTSAGHAHPMISLDAHFQDWQAGSKYRVGISAISWGVSQAINRLTLRPYSGNFVAGTRATLYGLAGG